MENFIFGSVSVLKWEKDEGELRLIISYRQKRKKCNYSLHTLCLNTLNLSVVINISLTKTLK